MIRFNEPPIAANEIKYLKQAVGNRQICGDGMFTRKCNQWIELNCLTSKALLTTSCTHALELAALLINTQAGDEIIMPSYTFVSTANAFVLRGAQIVFVDIRPDTMNINENLIAPAITNKTKAIVPVHYAGVACEMDAIMNIAAEHRLTVIEDAAQGMMSNYNGKALGTIGAIGCYSFHATKNYTMGEGGAILIQNENYMERAEIIREKGTNRSNFIRGQVDKYTWVDVGSSYLPSELNAAYLYAQLEEAELIDRDRLNSWSLYYELLKELEESGFIELPHVPAECKHNGHMFYIKANNLSERYELIEHLKKNDITASFHYIPLHSSPAGLEYGRFHGEDKYTTEESERLVRLPMYYGLKAENIQYVALKIKEFYEKR